MTIEKIRGRVFVPDTGWTTVGFTVRKGGPRTVRIDAYDRDTGKPVFKFSIRCGVVFKVANRLIDEHEREWFPTSKEAPQ